MPQLKAFLKTLLTTPHWWSVAGLSVLVSGATAWGGSHCVKAHRRCGIPGEYAYGVVAAQPPKVVISTAVLNLRPATSMPAKGEERGAVKGFQLQEGKLQIDHCAVSRMAVLLDQQGRCRISLQAEQNTAQTQAEQDQKARDAGTAQGGSLLQTGHIKRNEFHVVVTGYGVPAAGDRTKQSALGKPVLFQVEVCPFWVQRGESRDLIIQTDSADVTEYFGQIDHVELSFWYR